MQPLETLCRQDEIPDGGAIALDLAPAPGADGGDALVLLRRGQQVFAYENACPHAGRRLDWSPGRFLFDNGLLVCTAHGACFQPQDGLCVTGPCRGESLRTVAIAVEDGFVRRAVG